MGGFSDFVFGKDAEVKEVAQKPWQRQGINYLLSLLSPQQVPTAQVAGLSAPEQQGQGILSSILSGGAFADPSTSGLYRGLRNEMAQEESQGVDTMRRRAQLAGGLNSSGAIGAEAQFRTGMANRRLSLLGNLFEQERARDNPYTRLQAGSAYGALPRLLQQAQFDAQQQAAMAPFTMQAALAQALMAQQPTTYMQPPTESRLGQIMQMGGQALPMLAALA